MQIHHLKCGVMRGTKVAGEHLICHLLLIESPQSGLILVDAGFGKQDLVDPVPRLGWPFSKLFARPVLDPALAAVEQIKAMGYAPGDVQHIVLTHMDLDHTGGLVDFPEAQVHVHHAEHEVALLQKGFRNRSRYKPVMWSHNPQFVTYAEGGENWLGFESIRNLKGLPPEILLIPTAGHTRGHSAVAIQAKDGWVLHAGDAYFDHREVHQPERECACIFEILHRIDDDNRSARLCNQARLRALVHSDENVEVFCAHNPTEFPSAGGTTV